MDGRRESLRNTVSLRAGKSSARTDIVEFHGVLMCAELEMGKHCPRLYFCFPKRQLSDDIFTRLSKLLHIIGARYFQCSRRAAQFFTLFLQHRSSRVIMESMPNTDRVHGSCSDLLQGCEGQPTHSCLLFLTSSLPPSYLSFSHANMEQFYSFLYSSRSFTVFQVCLKCIPVMKIFSTQSILHLIFF